MDKELIAQRLITLRAKRSRNQVANDLGISVSALQMYETGHRIPRDEIKVKLASYYNKTVQEIFF
ncbi:helix-turn-helix transcriptional regulator [Bacillus licheniformis]|nr:helix-turn-helix transcriptional regulator [Bacillus licheniformis]MCY8531069.1 helix-turn-helix transcriptional regulator [Bacillus licheniformis]